LLHWALGFKFFVTITGKFVLFAEFRVQQIQTKGYDEQRLSIVTVGKLFAFGFKNTFSSCTGTGTSMKDLKAPVHPVAPREKI
jgi:hypothetical protein